MAMPPDYAWQNGAVVPWDRCLVHARSQGAFWGANVFEGVRGYWHPGAGELRLFRLDDHLDRLGHSMRALWMPARHSPEQLRTASAELIRANRFTEDVHLCLVAYFDTGPGFDPLCHTEETGVHITAIAKPRSGGFVDGVAASISSWRRISDDTMPPRIKTGANYHNSRLAQHEAVRNGYDTTLLLNGLGQVAEAPGACVMMLRDDVLVTPPGTSGVLEGITVDTVVELAGAELGVPVERRPIDRTELYTANEVFLCGTLAEILPITSVDRLAVGSGVPGVLTRKLQELYTTATLGDPPFRHWSTAV